ncbi:MAG: glycine/betaine ABC transporter, partial [Clostridiales bacterium]|nr:glycine/betaine ABC transporter [Clostridiales bacterium]
MINLHIGDAVEVAIDWLTQNLAPLFSGIKAALWWVINGFAWVFTVIPWYVMVLLLAIAAWRLSSRGVAIFTGVGL